MYQFVVLDLVGLQETIWSLFFSGEADADACFPRNSTVVRLHEHTPCLGSLTGAGRFFAALLYMKGVMFCRYK